MTDESNTIIGHIDCLSPDKISGWTAKALSPEPISVRLQINGRTVSEQLAIRFRKGLLKEGLHPTGYCGFKFTEEDFTIKEPKQNIKIYADNMLLREADVSFPVSDIGYTGRNLFVCLPTCGMHLMRYVLSSIFRESHIVSLDTFIEDYKNKSGIWVLHQLDYNTNSKDLTQYAKHFDHIFLLVRDPRDFLVNQLELFCADSEFDGKVEDCEFHKLFSSDFDVSKLCKKYFHPLKKLVKFDKSIIVKFEDVIENELLFLDYITTNTAVIKKSIQKFNTLEWGPIYGKERWHRWFDKKDIDMLQSLLRQYIAFFDYQDSKVEHIHEKFITEEETQNINKLRHSEF